MDDDRKYKQRGYQDSKGDSNGHRPDRPKQNGPKPSIDVTGPRLPRLLQNVAASRCFNCSTTLPLDVNWKGNCPKCNSPLHCCKQCAHFEPSTRFQCLKPIQVRIAVKDQANDCELFKQRVTIARDVAPPPPTSQQPSNNNASPRTPSDARTAFDNLFKK
jgi:hypothetical protein